MTVQATQMYNGGYEALMADGESPTNATAGEFMWVLVEKTYSPLLTHTTGTNLGGYEINDAGSLAPINATSVAITAIGTESFFQTGNVSIGPYVSGLDDYRYLVLVRPATAASYTTAAELIFYIDLTGSDSNDTVSAGESVTVNMTSSGWFKMVQS